MPRKDLTRKERCPNVMKSETPLAGEPNECPDLQPSIIPPIRSMYRNISCIWPKMRTSLGRVWLVDLLVAVRVLPLQFASLLLVTLPITMPRLLALQLANPASVVEGAQPNPDPSFQTRAFFRTPFAKWLCRWSCCALRLSCFSSEACCLQSLREMRPSPGRMS